MSERSEALKPTLFQPLLPEIQAVLAAERNFPPAFGPVRERALERARSAFREAGPLAAQPWRPRALWSNAAFPVAALCALAAAAVHGFGSSSRPVPSSNAGMVALAPPATDSVSLQLSGVPADRVADPVRVEEPVPAPDSGLASVPRVGKQRPVAASERMPMELRLLQRARAAVATGEFTSALGTLDEYEHRFPTGRLREESEALRVKALAGLGKDERARQAADSFRARFPRSVLLSPVENAVRSRP